MFSFRHAMYYFAGVAHVIFMLLVLLAGGTEALSIAGAVGEMGPTNLFGPSDFKGPRNESDPGLWLVPEDFDPVTKPYDSFRGYFVYFPLDDAHINFGQGGGSSAVFDGVDEPWVSCVGVVLFCPATLGEGCARNSVRGGFAGGTGGAFGRLSLV